MSIVVPKLGQRDPEAPSPRTSLGETAEESFNALIDMLDLTVRLVVVGRAESQFCPCRFEQLLPKVDDEYQISVRDDGAWQTVDLVDLLHIELSHL